MTTTTMMFVVVVLTYFRQKARAEMLFECPPCHPFEGGWSRVLGAFTSNTESTGTLSGTLLGVFWLGLKVRFTLRKMKKYPDKEPPEDKIIDPF